VFAEAQRVVRWHYQWLLVHEFLPATVGQGVVDDVLQNGRKHYRWRNDPFIPVEFSVATYRFGHSRPQRRALLYLLREADVTEEGERLGPVGAGSSPKSSLGDWTPVYGTGAEFTMVDLLSAAGVVAAIS
jgi:hypothetical protein